MFYGIGSICLTDDSRYAGVLMAVRYGYLAALRRPVAVEAILQLIAEDRSPSPTPRTFILEMRSESARAEEFSTDSTGILQLGDQILTNRSVAERDTRHASFFFIFLNFFFLQCVISICYFLKRHTFPQRCIFSSA